ncbi:MAG: DEAD/DEAH box helicase, partial [Candidatus Hodarchaeales archaeon]
MPLIGKVTRTKENVKILKGSSIVNKNRLKKEQYRKNASTKVQSLNGYFSDSKTGDERSLSNDHPLLTISAPEDWISALESASEKNYETVYTEIHEAEELIPGVALESLKKWLPGSLIRALGKSGVTHLFDFQTRAFKMILNAKDVVITAPTGAGKTEAFLLPLVARYHRENLERKKNTLQLISSTTGLKRSRTRVLAIYPTKALAADQKMKFDFFLGKAGFNVATFDGDTSTARRRKIYANPPEIIIT